MRNRILLMVFFVAIVALAVMCFVPNIEKCNNIDTLEASLGQVKKRIPETDDIYFFLENTQSGPPEIYYKTQFVLAPRTVISTTPDKVPTGSHILMVKDKSNPGLSPEIISGSVVYISTDAAFQIKLLKKP